MKRSVKISGDDVIHKVELYTNVTRVHTRGGRHTNYPTFSVIIIHANDTDVIVVIVLVIIIHANDTDVIVVIVHPIYYTSTLLKDVPGQLVSSTTLSTRRFGSQKAFDLVSIN